MSKDKELLQAVQNDNIDEVRRLLKEGAKATYFDEDSFASPIYAAAENENTEMFKIILEALNNSLGEDDMAQISRIANDEIRDIVYNLKEKQPKNIAEQFKANDAAEKQIEDDRWKKRQEARKQDPHRISQDRMKQAKEALEKNLQFRQNENIEVAPIITPQTSKSSFVPPPPPPMPNAGEEQRKQQANPNIPTPPPMPRGIPTPPPMPNAGVGTAQQASQSFIQNPQEETARTTQHEQHTSPNIPQKPAIPLKPTPEQVKMGEMRLFLTNNHVNPRDFGVEDLFHYISSTKNTQNPNLVNKIINPYHRVLEKIVKEIDINKREQFMNLVENLIEEHPHKDKFDKINRLYKDIPTTKPHEQAYNKPSYEPEQTHGSRPPSYEPEQTHDSRPPSYEPEQTHDSRPPSYEPEQTHDSRPPSYEPEQASQSSEKERLSNIINSLKELSNNTEIIGGLKQSRKHIEFKEQVKDIIESYNLDLSKVDANIRESQKLTPIVKAKLKALDKWCEETAKIDNAPTWRNIGNFIKHSLTGNRDKAAFYKKAIKNAAKNTNEALEKIKNSINNPSFSSNVPPPNKDKGGRQRGL